MGDYRSIGGRANMSGIERVNRDGQMEVLPIGETEVTPRERINWYNKANLDKRGNLPEEIYPQEKVDNISMNLKGDERTRLPRNSQYSTESRLSESRGEKIIFQESVGNDELAFGITPGMVFTEGDSRNVSIKNKKNDQKVLENKSKLQNELPLDGNNSNYSIKDANVKKAYCKAFTKVAKVMLTESHLSNQTILHISDLYGVPVEDVMLLEKISLYNKGLTNKYSKIENYDDIDVPGLKGYNDDFVKESDDPENDLEDEDEDEDIEETAKEVGLV